MPLPGCRLCDRLAAFRDDNRARFPGWHNDVVPPFGPDDARLLIVGLAPGLRGANRTGRPFTGDGAGTFLLPTLGRFGLAAGAYNPDGGDGLELRGCRITNAVRCVPPGNRPTPDEIGTCGRFLAEELRRLGHVRVILALGRIAHGAVLAALGDTAARFAFAHGQVHGLGGGRWLVDSYHCSRQNTNTGRLTPTMFDAVFRTALDLLGPTGPQ